MIPRLLGALWLLAILGCGRRWQRFQLPKERMTTVSANRVANASGPAIESPHWTSIIGRFGEFIIRLVRFSDQRSDPMQALKVGMSAAVGLVVAPISFWLVAPIAAIGWCAPSFVVARKTRRHLARVTAAVPETVDLLAVAFSAGLTTPLALAAVVRHSHGELRDELAKVLLATQRGSRLSDALAELPERVGDSVRPLVSTLIAADRLGASVQVGLGQLAEDLRRQSERRAKQTALRVPVLMIFPLVLCVLPAFALLTVAPLIASALQTLRL